MADLFDYLLWRGDLDLDAYTGGFNLQIAFCTAHAAAEAATETGADALE